MQSRRFQLSDQAKSSSKSWKPYNAENFLSGKTVFTRITGFAGLLLTTGETST